MVNHEIHRNPGRPLSWSVGSVRFPPWFTIATGFNPHFCGRYLYFDSLHSLFFEFSLLTETSVGFDHNIGCERLIAGSSTDLKGGEGTGISRQHELYTCLSQ